MTETLASIRLSHRAAVMFALSVVLGLVLSSVAEASILLPENSTFNVDLDQMIASLEKQATATSTSSSSNTSTAGSSSSTPLAREEEPEENEILAWQLVAMASQTEGSTSGTSSSTSGPSGGSGGASMLAGTAAILPNLTPTERCAFERSLFLPDAPGNQLLRPPQA